MFDPRYLKGIELFNSHEFFDCHDELEDLWNDTVGREREFYQGLIQAAVALFHFRNGNFGGARRMYESSGRYLEPYGDNCQGLDLKRFRKEMEVCFDELLRATEYPTGAQFDPALVPRPEIRDVG